MRSISIALQPEYSIVEPEWLNPTYRALELRISYNQWGKNQEHTVPNFTPMNKEVCISSSTKEMDLTS
jgi:hypothetical protein